jgi:HSP20 family protein
MAREPQDWMWAEAVAMLTRAERLHDRFFQPRATATRPAWEPPVDVMETETAILILIALPGVAPHQVEAVLEDGTLVVSGRRTLPRELQTATIHRLELPQGRFERRIPVPPGRYDGVNSTAQDGCLLISLHKAGR